ncbi:MAG: hypothetical protein AB7F66_03695 [Bacteriovoracia bacterium]
MDRSRLKPFWKFSRKDKVGWIQVAHTLMWFGLFALNTFLFHRFVLQFIPNDWEWINGRKAITRSSFRQVVSLVMGLLTSLYLVPYLNEILPYGRRADASKRALAKAERDERSKMTPAQWKEHGESTGAYYGCGTIVLMPFAGAIATVLVSIEVEAQWGFSFRQLGPFVIPIWLALTYGGFVLANIHYKRKLQQALGSVRE